MNYRELAKTGVKLPAVGLGTWQYRGGTDPLRTGVRLGAGFIDTAESYGTEDVVGQAIKGSRNEIFLATKLSPRHFRHSDVVRSADTSLKRLKTDYLDLYQLHWPNYTIPIEETMGAMESLVDGGKVRFIGVSNFMLRDLKRAQRAMTRYKIVSNQVRYNLIERTIEFGLLDYCREQDITVIAHSPLATSLPTIKAKDRSQVIDAVTRATSRTAAQIALNWCLSKQGVVVIPKADSIDHVKENCQASDFELSPEELRLLNSAVQFRRRRNVGIELRRVARYFLQLAGRSQ
jgi:diketogulonate reductase-like aldo/keto reductase